jgi:type I restriction enzyme S subunit
LAHCAGRAIGATRPRIARKSMAELPILVPTKHLQETFGEFAKSNHEMKTRLKRQTVLLEQARDILLPRLMNGTLDPKGLGDL